MTDHCAIDFGTSNSAVAIPQADGRSRLVVLEGGQRTMPTAVFYQVDAAGTSRAYGRAAIAAYVDGVEGRLMRSMKSILGSDLAQRSTDVGGGQGVKYFDVVAGFLKHLKHLAEAEFGRTIARAVLGRPVFFVDDDPVRDARAQAVLDEAARAVGFAETSFQYEPIAAAFDFEQTVTREQIVLVCDIGGGTSDFSVVRVGPERARRLDRKPDILANHGVHIAGTDFDRHIELACMLGELGYRSVGPAVAGAPPREVPSAVYFDLATWHLINTVYTPQRVAELRGMRACYAEPRHHARLMTVLETHLGHELLARAEAAKIAVAAGAGARIDLAPVEPGLAVALTEAQAAEAIRADLARIVATAVQTVADAGLAPQHVAAVYFTGGSTGLRLLAGQIAAQFPAARAVTGDRFASVATGLGLYAALRYGVASAAAG
jgi:hypothetical chaperone protein